MFTQSNGVDFTTSDVLEIATIGFYESKAALDIQIQREDGPDISVGRMPLKGPSVFYPVIDGCADPKKNLRTDGRTYLHCLPEEVYIRNLESWKETLNDAMETLMTKQGLVGCFTCELAELAVFGDGYGENFPKPSADSPADSEEQWKVATVIVIVNPDDKYSGGRIRMKCAHHDNHRDYDFQTNSKKGLISVLLCFNGPGTEVETEPVQDGYRAHLTYNVYLDSSDLTITGTKRRALLEHNMRQLVKRPSFKSSRQIPVFLTLMRTLVQTYECSSGGTPQVVLEFYYQIIEGICEQAELLTKTRPYPTSPKLEATDQRTLPQLRMKARLVMQWFGGEESLHRTFPPDWHCLAARFVDVSRKLNKLAKGMAC